MKYIVIGRIAEKKKVEAYKLFCYDNRKTYIYIRDEIKQLLINENIIVGLDMDISDRGNYVLKRKHSFMWEEVPECDSRGMPEDNTEHQKLTLIGINGFKELKVYIAINTRGRISVYDAKEAYELAKDGRLKYCVAKKDNKVLPLIKEQIGDKWLEDAGYTKNMTVGEKLWS